MRITSRRTKNLRFSIHKIVYVDDYFVCRGRFFSNDYNVAAVVKVVVNQQLVTQSQGSSNSVCVFIKMEKIYLKFEITL